MRRARVAAIDVGTTKVCSIIADKDDKGGIRILGVGVVPSHGLQKGLVINVNDARESIRQSVRQAEKTAGTRLESAFVGVTGRHVTSTNSHGAVAITRNDQLVRPEDLKRVLDVARSIKVPNEQKLLHIIPRTFIVDGQDGVQNPVGMHGFRLDVETHIVTAAVTSIQNLTKCIRSVGIEVEDLVMEPLASAESVLTDEEKESGVLLADIGGGTTDIAVFKDSTIFHTSVLPVAGYQITRDISVGLGLSFELAEEMKKKYANVTPDDGNEQNEDEQTLSQDGHSISYSELSTIIRARVEELLRLIVLELPHSDQFKMIPSGLVLTGGGANLPGVAQLAEQITRLPVRIGYPIQLWGVSDSLNDPAYATAVGLLLWKARNKGTQKWSPPEVSVKQSFLSRIFKFLR